MNMHLLIRWVGMSIATLSIGNVWSTVSFDQIVCSAIETWTYIDTAAAIAHADRSYFDDAIASSHLNLYALLQAFAQRQEQPSLSAEEIAQMRILLRTIARSNFLFFATSVSDESACVRVTMKKMLHIWDALVDKQGL